MFGWPEYIIIFLGSRQKVFADSWTASLVQSQNIPPE